MTNETKTVWHLLSADIILAADLVFFRLVIEIRGLSNFIIDMLPLFSEPSDLQVSHSSSMSHQRLENPTKDGDFMFSRMVNH